MNMAMLNYEIFLLPSTTTIINLSRRGLTQLPDLSKFTNLRELDCGHNQLTSLPPLNTKLQVLDCGHNQLTSLPPLNTNLHSLDCCKNQLTVLPRLNDNLTLLFCAYNQLTKLPILNDKLQVLYCHENRLPSLPILNYNLQSLVCYNNQLTILPPLHNGLHTLYCVNNKLDYLMNDDTVRLIKIKNKKIHNFRHFYYSLKFKSKFRNWLWIKVREPKIRINYSPLKLMDLLYTMQNENDEYEFDNLLNNW